MPRKKSTIANARQCAFAKLRVEGLTQGLAYRAVYGTANPRTANEQGCRLEANPLVKSEMERLRAKSARKTLLSLNDRLAILADIAQSDGETPAARNAKARAIEVYSRISGDQAPDRHEVTGKNGAPVAVTATLGGEVSVTATVTRLTVRDRIKLLRERREAEKAAREAPRE